MPLEMIATDAAHDSQWEPPHEDVPTRRLPMSARVEAASAPHRALVDEVTQLPGSVLVDLAEAFGTDGEPQRAARLIAGVMAIQTSIEGEPANAQGALSWFFGPGSSGSPSFAETLDGIQWTDDPDERLAALLPYVLDPFGLTTRRALLSGRACRRERSERKRLGTFYTPGDVARSLAGEVITARTASVLDPACGAGVFLRAAFTQLAVTAPAERAVESLYGVDIDAAAVDACALVLAHDWMMRQALRTDEFPVDRFTSIRSRLVRADALELFAEPFQSRLFQGPAPTNNLPILPAYFDAVLTNPPFARLGTASSRVTDGYASLRAARDPGGVNMMWPFWELVGRAVGCNGHVGIVLPLSAAYLNGDTAGATRGAVFSRGGWEMRFFDRTPDALFGDDVKQRIALALRRPGAPGLLRTTATRRWSADRRASALRGPNGDGVDLPSGPGRVLKIGSVLERDVVEHLRSLRGTLGDATSRARLVSPSELDGSQGAIAIAPTAYNWIGAFRDTTTAHRARQNAAGKLGELLFPSRLVADAAYGMVVSHVFLWWWRATGDLFHVPLTAVTEAPFPIHECRVDHLEALATAGRDCWLRACEAPIVAVNKGVTTVGYRPAADSEALDLVDLAVGEAFGLRADFLRFARDDAGRLRIAGRTG
jgi:hypothetical protein